MKGKKYKVIKDLTNAEYLKQFIGEVVIPIEDTVAPFVVFEKDYVEGWTEYDYDMKDIPCGVFYYADRELEEVTDE